MTALAPLEIHEAEALVDGSIRDFLAERLPADEITDARVERMRDDLHARLLPHGVLTPGHRFDAIVDDGRRVGQVWFGELRDGSRDVYICEIQIDEGHRRRGHARSAIELILDHAVTIGARRVGLTVARVNTGAIALYESLGFVTVRGDDTELEMWIAVDASTIEPSRTT